MKKTTIYSTFVLLLVSMLTLSCNKIIKEEKAPEAVSVCAFEITGSKQASARNYVGTFEGSNSTTLSPTLGGTVKQVYVHSGQYVNAGQLLVLFDSSQASQTYNAAKATLEQAEDGYRRLKQVYDQGSLAEVKWVEMKTKYAQAQSALRIAEKNLNDCRLCAPFSGYVGNVTVDNGMNLLPNQPAVTLVEIDNMNVLFTVPENEISSIHIGDTTTVVVPALGDVTYSATVVERGVVADALSHSYTIKLSIPNRDRNLLPGMVSRVLITSDNENSEGYVVPARAVQTNAQGTYIWLVEDGKAQRRFVSVLHFTTDGVAISGLNEGDVVITDGFLKIGTGTEVKY